MLLCAFHTGMRQSELFGLQWRDVDLARGRLQVLRAYVRGKYKIPKNGKPHPVPISPAVTELLREMARSREAKEGIHTDPGPVF